MAPAGQTKFFSFRSETPDLGTKFVRIVVTDDAGRYLMPGLPKANYRVWVRGYGLVDSAKVKAAPGRALNLAAVVAPSVAAAAEYRSELQWRGDRFGSVLNAAPASPTATLLPCS